MDEDGHTFRLWVYIGDKADERIKIQLPFVSTYIDCKYCTENELVEKAIKGLHLMLREIREKEAKAREDAAKRMLKPKDIPPVKPKPESRALRTIGWSIFGVGLVTTG